MGLRARDVVASRISPVSAGWTGLLTGRADNCTTDQPMGAASCTATTIGDTGHTLSEDRILSTAESRFLALSGAFRVGNLTAPTVPVVESVEITSVPGSDGEYVKDHAIEVTVTGTP